MATGRRTIGISDMLVSSTADDVLITYALGSCLGVTIYDPHARVGGLLHVMLPDSGIDPAAASTPYKFVDTGVPLLFKSAYALGARKERIIAKVAGGAATGTGTGTDHFQIGKRNFLKLRELFWRNGVLIAAQDVGGTTSRTMLLEIATGEVRLKMNGAERVL
jgi:chemotaxis protein CheD